MLSCVSPQQRHFSDSSCILYTWHSLRPEFGLHMFGVRVSSVNSDLLKESFVWHLAKVKASYFTATLATGNSIDFVVWAFDFWRKGRDTPSPTQSLPCIPQWVFSLLITHSLPPPPLSTQSYLYSPVSQVTGLHSVAYIQHYILHIALFESMQWFITNPRHCNQTDLCCSSGLVQPLSRIFRRRANLFPPLVPDSASVCQLLTQKSLKC